MRKVIFTENIGAVEIDNLPNDTLMVVHEMYDTPNIDVQTVDWLTFKNTYTNYETSQYIIVGANRMITPSNRCDMVNDFLQVMTKSIPKISIDTSPFIGEPWRLWYHYSLALGEWLGVDYSYPIERDWLRWFYLEQNHSKISADYLPMNIKNTYSDLSELDTSFEVNEVNEIQEEYYTEAKEHVFEKYSTPKLLTNNLLKILNKYFHLDFGHESYLTNRKYRLPDLGIYRYIMEENKRRMDIYNLFTKERSNSRWEED